jgi:hypothetical protein
MTTDHDDAPEETVLSYRVADYTVALPPPGTTIEPCSHCGEPVWRTPGTPVLASVLCFHCAPAVLAGSDFQIAISRRQRELLHARGIGDDRLEDLRADTEARLRRGETIQP